MIILELNSREIINLSKRSKKFSRYNTRENVKDYHVDRVGLLDLREGSNNLNIYFYVKSSDSSSSYRVDLCIVDFKERLRDYLIDNVVDSNDSISNIINKIRKFFSQEFRSLDIKLRCSCPDFKYRFMDSAKKNNFYAGLDDSDSRSSPNHNKINPNYEGSVCKHLMRIITNPSKWYEKVLRSLANIIKNNKEIFL